MEMHDNVVEFILVSSVFNCFSSLNLRFTQKSRVFQHVFIKNCRIKTFTHKHRIHTRANENG